MKQYSKKIITLVMATALLLGSILVDYRQPVSSRAEGQSVSIQEQEGQSVSIQGQEGQPSPQVEGEGGEQPLATQTLTEGTVIQQGTQETNSPSNQSSQELPRDITAFVDITLWNFGIAEQKNGEYQIKDGQYIVENGEFVGTKTPPQQVPEIKQSDDFLLKYVWNVKKENMKHVREGNYFEFSLPDQNAIKSATFASGDILSNNEKLGEYTLRDGLVRATFTGDFRHKDYIDNGSFEFWAYAMKIEGEGQEFEIPIKHGETVSNKFKIKIQPPNKPNAGFDPGNFSNMPDDRKILLKGGYQDDASTANNLISYTLTVNSDWLAKSYPNSTPGKRTNIVVSDLLPETLELRERGTVENPESVYISVPMYFPAVDKDGKVTNKLSRAIWWEGSHRVYPRGDNKKIPFSYEKTTTGSWEDFLKNFKEKKQPYRIGIWEGVINGVKRWGVAVDLGESSHHDRKYSDLFGGKEQLEKAIDRLKVSDNPRYRINDEQAKGMKAFYSDKNISAYQVVFYTKITNSKIKEYINIADIEWLEPEKKELQVEDKYIRKGGVKAQANYGTEKINIKIEKEWNNTNKTAPSDIEEITFALIENGTDEAKRFTLKRSEGWKTELKDCYKTIDQQPIVYSVKEVSKVDKHSPIYSAPIIDSSGNMTFKITNTELTEVAVEKKWVGNYEGESLPKVEVKLLANDVDTGVKLELKAPEWKGLFQSGEDKTLYKYDVNGNEIVYKIVEITNVPNYKAEITGNMQDGFTITNKKIEIPKIDIKVKKKWLQQDGKIELPKGHKSIKDAITVQLFDKKNLNTAVAEATIEKSNWEHIFKNIPKQDSSGTDIDYMVKEKESFADFATELASVKKTQDKYEAVLENRLVDKKTSIVIKKIWKNENNEVVTSNVPEKVLVNILKKLSENNHTLVETAIELNEKSNWMREIELPDLDENGDKIEYIVQEDTKHIPVGYFLSDLKGPVIENGKSVFYITNTKIPKTSLNVEKKWVDEDGVTELLSTYQKIPDVIRVQLVANNSIVPGKVLTLKKEESWKGKFENLSTCDPLGRPIEYTVTELDVPEKYFYTRKKDNDNTIVITNRKMKDSIEITIAKRWESINGTEITEQNRLPGGVKIRLFADGKPFKLLQVFKEKGWVYKEVLPKLDKNGKEISYTIEEVDLYGYKSSIVKGADGYSFTVTNKEVPTPPNPYIPPYTPDQPFVIPPDIPTPPAPRVPIDEIVIEDDEVVLADNDEPEEDPEEEEITDDIPKVNKDVPKTHDFLMNGAANPLAVSTLLMMGYGVKKLLAKKKKN